MITIIVDTKEEYDEMLKFAHRYACKQVPIDVCGNYPPCHCSDCYKEQHSKCGIRVIPVDNDKPDQL